MLFLKPGVESYWLKWKERVGARNEDRIMEIKGLKKKLLPATL